MKVLLMNPLYKENVTNRYEKYYIRSGSRWPHSGIKRKGLLPHYLPFPFSLAYGASLLAQSSFEVFVMDAVALDMSEDELLEKTGSIKPDIVFYEVTTPTACYDLLLSEKIKEIYNPVTVIGGAHASVYASEILRENKSVDFVLKGEYEESLLKLAKALKEKDNKYPAGAVFRDKGNVVDNGFPNPIEPLDGLPFPLRDVFPSNEKPSPLVYWDGFCQRRPLVQMQSSRGCNYACYFCLWNQAVYNNGEYRTFSVNRVIEEMQDSIIRYGAKEIYFDDDNFTMDKKRISAICEEIMLRGVKVKWSCMGSVMNLSQELLRAMSISGCIGIKFGLESGSDRILKTVGKPIDTHKARDIIKLCKKYNIKTQAAFTLGLLEETGEDIKKTFCFADSLDADSVQVSIATPFPGTEFFRLAKEKGLMKGLAWDQYDAKNGKPISFSGENKRETENLRKNFLLRWFLKKALSPLWYLGHMRIILRTLKGLGSIFLFKQICSVVIDESGNG